MASIQRYGCQTQVRAFLAPISKLKPTPIKRESRSPVRRPETVNRPSVTWSARPQSHVATVRLCHGYLSRLAEVTLFSQQQQARDSQQLPPSRNVPGVPQSRSSRTMTLTNSSSSSEPSSGFLPQQPLADKRAAGQQTSRPVSVFDTLVSWVHLYCLLSRLKPQGLAPRSKNESFGPQGLNNQVQPAQPTIHRGSGNARPEMRRATVESGRNSSVGGTSEHRPLRVRQSICVLRSVPPADAVILRTRSRLPLLSRECRPRGSQSPVRAGSYRLSQIDTDVLLCFSGIKVSQVNASEATIATVFSGKELCHSNVHKSTA